MKQKTAKRWLISGRVQGVGFRFFAQSKAAELGITGWARNLDDGRVEVYATGTSEQLSNLAASLHLGPRVSEVRSVEETEDIVQNLPGFAIR